MRTPLRIAAVALVALAACADPPVQSAADRQGVPVTTPLSGQVIVQGTARGNVLVFLYDAANPPPPLGTGHPLRFLQLSGAEVFGAALHESMGTGPFAAAYTFPLVAPGTYLVAASLDADACLLTPSSTCRLADFDPFYDVTGEPNAGDLLGGHVDANSQLVPVVVPEPGPDGSLPAVTQIQVGVGGAALGDRPAFEVAVDPALTSHGGASVSRTGLTAFKLLSKPLNAGPIDERAATFLVKYVDDDHDGVPDLSPQGLPMLWPKVFVRKMAEGDPAHVDPKVAAGLRDENDLDGDGQLDPTGRSYDHLGEGGALVPADAQPDLVVLPATLVQDPVSDPSQPLAPLQLYAQLADDAGNPDVNKVVAVDSLPLAIVPELAPALDARDPAHPVPLTAMPPGRYSVIVLGFTGQTWRLPNELQPALAPALGFTPEASQGFVFYVAP